MYRTTRDKTTTRDEREKLVDLHWEGRSSLEKENIDSVVDLELDLLRECLLELLSLEFHRHRRLCIAHTMSMNDPNIAACRDSNWLAWRDSM